MSANTFPGNGPCQGEASLRMSVQILLTFSLIALLSACAPVISKQSLREVDPPITFQELLKDPRKYRGKVILQGRVIIETLNKMDETVMKVRQTELEIEKRPQTLDRSARRFLVKSAGFLDPEIYKEGREITVGIFSFLRLVG
jgi:outer membrane lipoprotein